MWYSLTTWQTRPFVSNSEKVGAQVTPDAASQYWHRILDRISVAGVREAPTQVVCPFEWTNKRAQGTGPGAVAQVGPRSATADKQIR